MKSKLTFAALLALSVSAVGCPSEPMNMMLPDMMTPGTPAKRVSKASTVAISEDDAIVAMVNPEDGSVSFFSTSNNQKLATLKTGGEPSSVVIHPDSQTAFVANRADATVVKVSGIHTATPSIAGTVPVGSEPVGLALSPLGGKLFVAEYGESHLSVIDTAAMTRADFVASIRNPRGIAVTNNGDSNEADETVLVSEFFGEPQADGEAKNDGRRGRVRIYGLDGSDKGSIAFAPFANSAASTGMGLEGSTAPNQLYSVAISNGRVVVPSVSASPALPLNSKANVYPVVYVGDLTTKQQVVGGNGTFNPAEQILSFAAPQNFLGELVDLDFVPNTNIAYAVSRAGDAVQRIDFSASPPTLGSGNKKQIDVLGTGPMQCQNPSGIVMGAKLQKAYVNCWVSRRLAVLDLTNQAVETVVDSAPLAAAGSPQEKVDHGRRLFFTGRGRWSGDGTAMAVPSATGHGQAWSSCGTCHPDGLTDNITWIFAAGPRQSTSMDGSFSHGSGPQKQRIFNWTAIIDEMHDFEANTRGTSGGLGAITTTNCGMLTMEQRTTTNGFLAGANTPLAAAGCAPADWNDINEYSKTIRPPKGRRFLDPASVARGAQIFSAAQAGCVKCHGGAGWTVSRRFYNPVTNNMAMQAMTTYTLPPGIATFSFSKNATQISTQIADAADDALDQFQLPPAQLSCTLREVGTFGVPMDSTRTNALEVAPGRAATPSAGGAMVTTSRAQGRRGYNVPSLYGLQVGGPFLHHGQAKTLDELFSDGKWGTHWKAGNLNFLSNGTTAAAERQDLINFLWSIDASTQEQAVPAGGFDTTTAAGQTTGCVCPGGAASC